MEWTTDYIFIQNILKINNEKAKVTNIRNVNIGFPMQFP